MWKMRWMFFEMLESLLWVAVGAIFGALGRFLITNSSSRLSNHQGFPFGTLLVNALGLRDRRICTRLDSRP